MKRNYCVKVFVILVALNLVFTSSGKKEQPLPEAKTSAEIAEIDIDAKYEEPVVVRIAIASNAASTVESWGGYSYTDNPWTELLKERYNIVIEVMWDAVQANGQYKTKLDLAIATNDLPDIIHTDNYSQFIQLANNDRLADLTEYYDIGMSDLAEEYCMQDGGVAQSFAVVDGKTMGLTGSRVGTTTPRLVFIRADWREELNLDAPKTMSDVIEIGKKFADAGEGRFALPLFKNLANDNMADIVGIANSLDAYPRIWIDDGSGNAVYGSVQEEMKDVLRVYADLYADGYLDPAFASLDGGKVGEQLTSDKIGVIIGATWLPSWPLNSLYERDGVDWECYAVAPFNSENDEIRLQTNAIRGTVLAVRKDFEYPEALFKITNTVTEKLDSSAPKDTGLYHTIKRDSDIGPDISVFSMNPLSFYYGDIMTNFNTYKNTTAAIDQNDESLLVSGHDILQYPKVKGYKESLDAGTKAATSDWVMGKLFYGEDSCYAHLTKYLEEGMLITDILPGYQTKTMALQWGNMVMLEDQYFVEIISGAKPVDEGFDEFVEAWNKMSGAMITEEVNEWYK